MEDIPTPANPPTPKTPPFRFSDEHTFGVTPFGVYCFVCNDAIGRPTVPITANTIQMHLQRREHGFIPDIKVCILATTLNNCIEARYGEIKDASEWITKKNTIRKCTCGVVFTSGSNVSRHQKTKKQRDPSSIHVVTMCNSYETSCGRVVDQTVMNKIENRQEIEICHQPPSELTTSLSPSRSITLSQSTSASLSTVSHSMIQSHKKKEYVPIQFSNRKWISTHLSHIKKLFLHLKRVDENLEPYLSMLKLLTINAKQDVFEQLRSDVAALGEEDNDGTLTFFKECTDEWVKIYCREHVNHLDGNVRRKIQNFFDEYILVNSGHNMNFNMRENESNIQKEMRLIITLSWKCYHTGELNDALKEELQPIVELIGEYKEMYGGMATEAAVQDMIQGLVIQRYFHFIFVEEKSCAFTLLLGQRVVAARLFRLKKASLPGSTSDRVLCMRPCGEYGSTLATQIHCYRLASSSLLTCTMKVSWDDILNQVTMSVLCHTLSPLIRNVRNMHSQKLEIRIKEVEDNGDITIDDYYFPRCLWSKLIPTLNDGLEQCLSQIFMDDEWKRFVDMTTALNVSRVSNNSTDTTQKDLLHYDFFVNQNGRLTNEKDLLFKDHVSAEVFAELTAHVMICLHGLGVGSCRVAEIIRIQLHQVYWKRDCLYYKTVSIKKPKSSAPNSRHVVHKLPPSTSRFLLLYDYVGRKYCEDRETFIFDVRHNPMDNDYDNKKVHPTFANIFGLGSNCNCLVMRHLYTSICNFLFPGDINNFDESIVSTVSEVAELSGHSSETHRRFYSSYINREFFFNKYHRNLGSDVSVDDEQREPLGMATADDTLQCLRSLKGVSASFLSDLQRDVVMDSCNNLFKHTFCSLGCGGGKSMTWTISTMRFQIHGHRPKTSLVVIPYCFLLEHHVSSMKSVMGQCRRRISIDSLKGNEIHENVMPNVLRDKDSLPSILFLSLEGMAALVKHHYSYLELLASEGYLFKIYLDECHTVLNELNFRDKYLKLQELSGLGVPMMVLSGSFQKAFISQYLCFMFGEEDESRYNYICDDNVVGNPCLQLRHIASEGYKTECCDYIRERLHYSPDNHIHVIVSTLDEGMLQMNNCFFKAILSNKL